MLPLLLLVAQDEAAFWAELHEKVKPLWIGKADPRPFAAPPSSELEALSAYAAGPHDAPLPAALEAAGWRVDWIPFGDEKLRLLREAPEAKRGRGILLTRPAGAPLALSAPHRFFDRHTGDIARGVFFRSKASALIENTAHRHWDRAEGAEHGPADPAHNELTAGHALAKGLAAGRAKLLLVQLHGFADEGAFAILSDGTDAPAPWARNAVEAFRAAKLDARLYGADVRRLGGTENVLGRHLRVGRSDDRFLHVEMSPPLRESLKADPSRLAEALRAALD